VLSIYVDVDLVNDIKKEPGASIMQPGLKGFGPLLIEKSYSPIGFRPKGFELGML
jgi:hypothetical protein